MTQHLHHFYRFCIFLKGGAILYMHTYIHIYTYHVDLKYVYEHILLFTNHFMKKRNTQKNLQNIIVVQMYEIVKD